MRLTRLDHCVLTVRDIEGTCRFYQKVLGMDVITFGDDRKAVMFGSQKINLHQAGREYEPKAASPTPGAADLCFIAAEPLIDVAAHLAYHHVPLVAGPVERTGALGPIQSLYIHDPDGNLIEIANYLHLGEGVR